MRDKAIRESDCRCMFTLNHSVGITINKKFSLIRPSSREQYNRLNIPRVNLPRKFPLAPCTDQSAKRICFAAPFIPVFVCSFSSPSLFPRCFRNGEMAEIDDLFDCFDEAGGNSDSSTKNANEK